MRSRRRRLQSRAPSLGGAAPSSARCASRARHRARSAASAAPVASSCAPPGLPPGRGMLTHSGIGLRMNTNPRLSEALACALDV